MKIFPSSQEKLITAIILSFLVGFFLGLSVKNNVKDVLFAVSALITACLAAYYAYYLNNKKEEKKSRHKAYLSGKKALARLMNINSMFTTYKEEFILPFSDQWGAFISIPPSFDLDVDDKFDMDSVTLLSKIGNSNLSSDLLGFQKNLDSTIKVINNRSKLHLAEVQPALEKAGFKHGQAITENDIGNALGGRVTRLMQSYTDDMIVGVDLILDRTVYLAYQLYEILPSENVEPEMFNQKT